MPVSHSSVGRLVREQSPLDTPTPSSSVLARVEADPASTRPLSMRPAMRGPPIRMASPSLPTIVPAGEEQERRQKENQLQARMAHVSDGSDSEGLRDVEEDAFCYEENSPRHGTPNHVRSRPGDEPRGTDKSARIRMYRQPQLQEPISEEEDEENLPPARELSPVRPASPTHDDYHSNFSLLRNRFETHFAGVQDKAPAKHSPKAPAAEMSSRRHVLGELHTFTTDSPTRTTKADTQQFQSYLVPPVPQHSRAEPSLRRDLPAPTPARKAAATPRAPPSTIKAPQRVVSDPTPARAPATAQRRVVLASPPVEERHSREPLLDAAPVSAARSRLRRGIEADLNNDYPLPDITGLTDGFASPIKARTHFQQPAVKRRSGYDPELNDALRKVETKMHDAEAAAQRLRQAEDAQDACENDLSTIADEIERDSGFGGDSPQLDDDKPMWYDAQSKDYYSRSTAGEILFGTRDYMNSLGKQLQAHRGRLDRLQRDQRAHDDALNAEIMQGMDKLIEEFSRVKAMLQRLIRIFSTPAPTLRPPIARTRSKPTRPVDQAAEFARADKFINACDHPCDSCNKMAEELARQPAQEKPNPGLKSVRKLGRLLAERDEKTTLLNKIHEAYVKYDPTRAMVPRHEIAFRYEQCITNLEGIADEIHEEFHKLHAHDGNEERAEPARFQQRRKPLFS